MTEDEAHSTLFGDLSQRLLSMGLGFRFQARGTSMEPAIRDGDLLQVMPVVAEELGRGDIVLFADGANFRGELVLSFAGGVVSPRKPRCQPALR